MEIKVGDQFYLLVDNSEGGKIDVTHRYMDLFTVVSADPPRARAYNNDTCYWLVNERNKVEGTSRDLDNPKSWKRKKSLQLDLF